jgi:hypothetical protein
MATGLSDDTQYPRDDKRPPPVHTLTHTSPTCPYPTLPCPVGISFIRHLALENSRMLPMPILIRNVLQATVDLTDMALGDEFIELLAGVINELPKVEHLILAGNKLTDEGLEAILTVGDVPFDCMPHQVIGSPGQPTNCRVPLAAAPGLRPCGSGDLA